MTASNRHRGGFTTLVALIAMGLVAVALTALGAKVAHDARRTATLKAEAQLRQLLLAGTQSVQVRSANWKSDIKKDRWIVALPTELSADGAKVEVTFENAGSPTISMSAIANGKTRTQTLSMRLQNGKWMIESARLEI